MQVMFADERRGRVADVDAASHEVRFERGLVDRARDLEPQRRATAGMRPANTVGHELVERLQARGVALIERALERAEVRVVVTAIEELGDDRFGEPRVAER